MMWLFYLYLWLPLITLGAWGLDFNFAYVHMILLEGYRALLHVLVIYLLIIVLMMVTLISWSQINLHRFGGLDGGTFNGVRRSHCNNQIVAGLEINRNSS